MKTPQDRFRGEREGGVDFPKDGGGGDRGFYIQTGCVHSIGKHYLSDNSQLTIKLGADHKDRGWGHQ